MTDTRKARENALAMMQTRIGALDACAAGPTAGETILAWGNSLAVKITDNGPTAVSIDKADAFEPAGDLPAIQNGRRETARPILRGPEAARHAAELRELYADMISGVE